jgi:hypothetical protein
MLKGRLRVNPGHVELVVREPIETAGRYEPTVRDAKRLADDVRAEILQVVEGEAAAQ